MHEPMTYPIETRDDDERDEQARGRFLDACSHAIYTALNDFTTALRACRTSGDARAISQRLDDLAKLVIQAQDDAADLAEQLED